MFIWITADSPKSRAVWRGSTNTDFLANYSLYRGMESSCGQTAASSLLISLDLQYLFLGNLSGRKPKMPSISPVYHPRKPHESQYYQCIEDNFERLEQVYGDQFSKKYGFFGPTSNRSSTVIWTAEFYIMALPGSNVKTAVTNSCSHFLVSAGTFVHPAIRTVLWSLESGFAKKS